MRAWAVAPKPVLRGLGSQDASGGPASLGRGASGHGGTEEAAGVIQQDALVEVDRGRQAAPQTTMAWGVRTPGEEA